MISNRYTMGQSSAIRKSRLEGKPSLLPKPRRPGSTDRLSIESRRPSNAGHRSSSAEPARGTFGSRLSREASATKLAINGRSRSQTGDSRYGPAATPQQSKHYHRATATPVRTPSSDHLNCSWEASLDRALAFVTIKDQRPISNVAWQRTEYIRVSEALATRAETSAMAFIRPLTITRFVDTVGAILTAIIKDTKLNNDNYVTKLPHLCKRLLYPGVVSKSWLRTVNTLHAFPHALALVAYLLDLLTHIETPVLDEWLYLDKDNLGYLRRDYLYKCWFRFQDPSCGHQFDDLNEEYLQNLKSLLGNDEEKIAELQQIIQKYSSSLEDEESRAGRAEEAGRVGRRGALAEALRALRAARAELRAGARAARDAAAAAAHDAARLDAHLDRAASELQRVCGELQSQSMCVVERGRVLDELDYAVRVHDSKRALADEIRKMVASKETELALWQKKTLESCGEYRQRLIHLSGLPALAGLAVDENELMGADCASVLAGSLGVLRAEGARLAARRADLQRGRALAGRRRHAQLEETKAKISEVSAMIEREQRALAEERAREAAEARAWAGEQAARDERARTLAERREEGLRIDRDLSAWETRDRVWITKLGELKEYIESQKVAMQRALDSARDKRAGLVMDSLKLWNEKLAC